MKIITADALKIHDVTVPSPSIWVESPITGIDSADIRQTDYNNSGEHGAFMSNNLYGSRTIGLQGVIKANDIAAYAALRRSFLTTFAIKKDISGRTIPKVVSFTTGDDLQVYVNAYLKDKPELPEDNPKFGRFHINLFCPYPYFLSSQNFSGSVFPPTGGGAVLPFVLPVVLDAQVGGSATVINLGTAPTFPTITLNGPLTNPTIQNITTGESLTLNVTLNAVQQAIITMNDPLTGISSILLGSQSLLANKTATSVFWELAVGANILRLTTTSSGDTGNAQVLWQNAYDAI